MGQIRLCRNDGHRKGRASIPEAGTGKKRVRDGRGEHG